MPAPRLWRNTVKGVGPGEVAVEPPPSQLISRRPPSSGPGLLPLLTAPSAARYRSTVDCIDAGVGPAAWNTVGTTSGLTPSLVTCAVAGTASDVANMSAPTPRNIEN